MSALMDTERMIDTEHFAEAMERKLMPRFPEGMKISHRRVIKTNDTSLVGMMVEAPGSNMSPTIYIDPYMDAVRKGALSLDDAAEEIYRLFLDNKQEGDFDVNEFIAWDTVKKRIVPRLISERLNTELLKDVPHERVLGDLVLVFAFLTAVGGTLGSILIHECHRAVWGAENDELKRIAFENAENLLPVEIDTLDNMMAAIAGAQSAETDEKSSMFVVTNEKKFYGACALLYPGVMEKMAERLESDIAVLPSSVHETILVPASKDKLDVLSDMVKEVNATQVADIDVLSDHAYFYSRKNGFEIC